MSDDEEDVETTTTGSHLIPASVKNVTVAVDGAVRKMKREVGLGTALGVLSSIAVAIIGVQTWAEDAGSKASRKLEPTIQITAEKLKLVAEELARHVKEEAESRARLERKQDRDSAKLDLLLDERRIPQWKRPSEDGGQ